MTVIESSDSGLRYNDAPLSTSTTDNWVARRGGLPPMVRAIARALMRNGHTESGAISLAIGAVKRWARGGGKVHPSTRARAAAAVAHWEAIKASTGRSEEELILRASSGSGTAVGAYAPGHPFEGNQFTKGGVAVGGPGSSTKAMAKPSGSKGGKGSSSAASKAAAAAAKQTALQNAVDSAANAVQNAQNAVDSASNTHDNATAAVAKAQAKLDEVNKQATQDVNEAQAREKNSAKGGVSGLTQTEAVQKSAQSRIEAAQSALDSANKTVGSSALSLKAANDRLTQAQNALAKAKAAAGIRHGGHDILVRDFVGETTGQGASLFLPAGPTKKQSQEVEDELEAGEADARHRFEGSDLSHCSKPGCGKSVNAKVHKVIAATSGGDGQPIPPVPRQVFTQGSHLRHAGSGHAPVPTGHVKGSPTRHAKAAAAQNQRNFTQVEPGLESSLKSMFADQRRGVLTRLEGKRGKQALRRAAQELERAGGPNEPPEIPPEDTGTGPEPPPPIISPTDLFNAGYWTDKTAGVLGPHLQTAGALAAQAVKDQVHLDPMHDDSTSLGALNDVLTQRAAAAAQYISGTTSKALTAALQAGVANGEGIPAIAKRINDVFDNADIVRAKLIAQNEVVGGYNEAAHAYASQLPPDVVGNRRWLAHHDDRTRPTHRLADGQEQPMGQPFWVGGSPMDHPGDKTAPPGEWMNCRCSVAYLPPGMGYGGIAQAAEDYVKGLKAQPPEPVSPYVVSGVSE